jgi:uncharacterized protein (TIGR02217 family)
MVWPVFPRCPTYGFTKRADYSETVIERESGIRTINRNWYYPLHTFSAVPMGEQHHKDIDAVVRFWLAIGGRSGRFLFWDQMDYRSINELDDAITAADQPLEVVPDSPGGYQMFKLYQDADALFTQYRMIQKPWPGTIQVAENNVPLVETTHWVLDYDTGIVTFTSPRAGVLTWGGQFYVPVMFESVPEFMISNKDIWQTSFALRELRLETE